jgi:hypothetical protein
MFSLALTFVLERKAFSHAFKMYTETYFINFTGSAEATRLFCLTVLDVKKGYVEWNVALYSGYLFPS